MILDTSLLLGQARTVAAAVAGRSAPPLSYATVRDYCESADLMPALAAYNGDLKDVQRCWILKTLLASVPPGSTLLEIGAGEPIVADLLGKMGYRVIAVDPYEGTASGPTDVDYFRTVYRDVEYIVDWFSAELGGVEAGSIDCCYSISVLEHVPIEMLSALFEAITRFSKPGALTVHAIDHVLLGFGEGYHARMLATVARCLGIDEDHLSGRLNEARNDSDAYFLSAEAHNKWRGTKPYDEFPMRRCISVQIAAPLG